MNPGSTWTEELLSHATWLRDLARSLVQDPSTADDLVQETWVRALGHPPRSEERGPRPWLARVLRNAVRQRRRAEGRRTRREQDSARNELLPSSAELAGRLESQRLLTDCVLRLPEPYRSTIVLRFYETLSSAEIARRRGLPQATVRSQLKRGLEQLRDELDRHHDGDRHTWMAALVPWASPIPTPVSGGPTALTLAAGALTMTLTSKLAAVAAVVVLVVAGYRLTRERESGPVEASRARESEDIGVAAVPVPAADTLPTVGEESALRHVVELPTVESSPASRFVLELVVVDEEDRPIAEAEAEFRGSGESDTRTADANGRVRLEASESWMQRLIVDAPGFARHTRPIPPLTSSATDLGRVTLQRGGSVSARVAYADGVPAEGAEVVLAKARDPFGTPDMERRRGPYDHDAPPRGTADRDGHFSFARVPQGTYQVWTRAEGTLWSATLAFDFAGTRDARAFDLVLDPLGERDLLEGIVQAPDGTAVAGSEIRITYDSQGSYTVWFAESDSTGAFESLFLSDTPHQVRAKDPGGRWADAVAADVEPGGSVVMRFRERRDLEVIVVDANGFEVDEVGVHALSADHGVGLSAMETDEFGSRTLLEPAEAYLVVAESPGYRKLELGPFQPGVLEEAIEMELERMAGIHGRVVADGRPVRGARVGLYERIVPVGGWSQLVQTEGFFTFLAPYSTETTISDEEGRFQFRPTVENTFLLRAEVAGYAPAELDVPPATSEELVLALGEGGAIEGRVTSAAGLDPTGTIVAVSRGDLHPLKVFVGEDGAYSFEHLMPGRWNVEIVPAGLESLGSLHMIADGPVEAPWVCEVFEGERTYFDLDLDRRDLCRLHGRLEVDGGPATGWGAKLSHSGFGAQRPDQNPVTTLAGDGSYAFSVPVEGSYSLEFQAPDAGTAAISVALELVAGEREWSLSLETGSVVVDGVPRAAKDDPGARRWLRWTGADGASAQVPLDPDSDQIAFVERFPAGMARILRYPLGPWRGEPETMLAFEVIAGEENRVSSP